MSGFVQGIQESLVMVTVNTEIQAALDNAAAKLAAAQTVAQSGALGSMPAPQVLLARRLLGETVQDVLTTARSLHPDNLATQSGKALAQLIDDTATQVPTLKQQLRNEGLLGKDGRFAGNPKTLSAAERSAQIVRSRAATMPGASNNRLATEAISAMADKGAAQKLIDALAAVQPNAGQDIDEFAQQLLKSAKLKPGQADAFLNLLQQKACDDLYGKLGKVLKGLEKSGLAIQKEEPLLEKIEAAYQKQQAGNASLQRFRADLGALGSDLVDAVAVSIPDRAAFIQSILDAFVTSEDAQWLLQSQFDVEGLTRLFEDWGRFRKDYTPVRAAAASRSLLGWLYEASLFNKTELQKVAEEVATRWKKGLGDLGIEVGDPTYHFDVSVGGKEATDHLADVKLTYKGKSVRVFAAVMEQKAESDIRYGVRQLENIPQKYSGEIMTSERGRFVMGKTMYVDLEAALAGLFNKDEAAPIIARLRAETGGETYKRVVIYAPESESSVGLREPGEDGVLRVAHPVTRQRMGSLYASLAFAFNVSPRRF
jgi:hypothetical protein